MSHNDRAWRRGLSLLRVASLAGGLLAATSSLAQQAPDPEFVLKLKQSEVSAIITVLSKAPLPWEQSNPLLQTLVKQVQEQQKTAAEEIYKKNTEEAAKKAADEKK